MKFASYTVVRPLLCGLLLLLVILGLLIGNQSWLWEIESDALYLVSLYKDLFVDHYSVSSWHTTPAPFFFPDAAIFFPLLRTIPDIGFAFVSYSCIFFLLFLAAFTRIAFLVSRDIFRSFLYVSSAAFLLVALGQVEDYSRLLFWFLYPSFHGGALLVGLALVIIFMSAMGKGYTWWSALVFLLLSALTIVSDSIILPQFLLPLLVTACALSLARLLPSRMLLTTVGLTAAAQLVAMITVKVIGEMELLHVPSAFERFSPDITILLENVLGFMHDMKYYSTSTPIFAAAFAGWMILAVSLLIGKRRFLSPAVRDRNAESDSTGLLLFLVIFSVLSVLGTIAAPIAVNRWAGAWCIRYAQVLYIFPLFLIAVAGAVHHEKLRVALNPALLIVIAFGLVRMAPGAKTLDAAGLKLPYPKRIQCLDALAGAHGLKYGYGHYWHAKYATILSRAGVRINQLKADLSIDEWISNPAWFFYKPQEDAGEFPKYEFIFVTPSTKAGVEQKFGKPVMDEYCYGIEVYMYNRESDIAFRNFLRIPASILLGRELPSSPASPERLSRYTPEGTKRDSAGTVIIPEHGEVSARFDPPATGEILEIAADGNDEYAVQFFSGETSLGHLHVPMANGPDIQIRYVRVPDSVQGKPFDRLVVRPLRGNGTSSIGHIFLYEDSY